MSYPIETRRGDRFCPMLVGTDGKAAGAVLAVTATAADIDLTTIPALPLGSPTELLKAHPNVIGEEIILQADGGDVHVIFGPTTTSVRTTNVPDPTKTGTNVVGLTQIIPNGQQMRCWIPPGADTAGGPRGASSPGRYLAYITATGTAKLRISPSNYT